MGLARVAPEKTASSARPACAHLFADGGEGLMATKKLSYAEQLRDPRWQRKRLEILSRDGFKCELCGDDKSTLHVHHKRYVKGRMPWEYDATELSTVCENCHESADHTRVMSAEVMSRLPLDGPGCAWNAMGLVAGWASASAEVEGIDHIQEVQQRSYWLGEIAAYLDLTLGTDMSKILELRDLLVCADWPAIAESIDSMMEKLRQDFRDSMSAPSSAGKKQDESGE